MPTDDRFNVFGTFLDTLRREETDSLTPRKSANRDVERLVLLPDGTVGISRAEKSRPSGDRARQWAVDDPEALVLDLLAQSGPKSVPDLVATSGLSLNLLLSVLERLIQFGLVARLGGSENVSYAVTPAGTAVRASYAEPIA